MCLINDINEGVALMGSFADGFEKKIRREVEQELKGDYDRKLAESRQQTEESKKEAEESRQQAEASKKEAEESRQQAEESNKKGVFTRNRQPKQAAHVLRGRWKRLS